MRKRDKFKYKAQDTLESKAVWSIVFIIVGIFLGSLFTNKAYASEECDFLQKLSPYQYEIAYKSYRAGQPYDLGLTAVAVAWQESKLGLYKSRLGLTRYDQSFGIMHTVAYWKTKTLSPMDRGIWVQKMITDDARSIDLGVQDLLYWQSRAKNNWRKGIAMYNGGGNPNYRYANSVVKVVKKLKQCNFN